METPHDAPLEEWLGIAPLGVSGLLTAAGATIDIRDVFKLLLGPSAIRHTVQPAASQQDALGQRLTVRVANDVPKGLLHHCTGESWRTDWQSRDVVEQLIAIVKQNANEMITQELPRYGDMHLHSKTS